MVTFLAGCVDLGVCGLSGKAGIQQDEAQLGENATNHALSEIWTAKMAGEFAIDFDRSPIVRAPILKP